MKRIFYILFIGIVFISTVNMKTNAQESFSQGFGLALKTSTNGFGGDVVYNFHPRMSLRLGYENLSFNTTATFEEQEISYETDINFKTGSVSLLYDFYLTKGIFLTTGAGLNLFHVDVDGEAASSLPFGDIEIPPDMIGDFNIQIDPGTKVSPYLGIGFGRTLGLKKKLAFAFEIGGFYLGKPNLTINSTGLLSPTSNPDHGHEEKLEHQIDQYTCYPVLKFSISYRIVNF